MNSNEKVLRLNEIFNEFDELSYEFSTFAFLIFKNVLDLKMDIFKILFYIKKDLDAEMKLK